MTLTVTAPERAKSLKAGNRLALVVEYDGTNYFGFQWQANAPTIQDELEKALEKLTGERLRIVASSRTDTGVHALGQVISFKTESALPDKAFLDGLNHYLPEDIAIKSVHRVSDSFLVRSMAGSREYSYRILNSGTRSPMSSRFAYRVGGELDVEAMDRACKILLGVHDFASFASQIGGEENISTVRQVYSAEVKRDGDMIIFNIIANAFVRHQIRNTMGALLQAGMRKMTEAQFRDLLDARQPGSAGPTAPACGLCLIRVNYPHSFEEMK